MAGRRACGSNGTAAYLRCVAERVTHATAGLFRVFIGAPLAWARRYHFAHAHRPDYGTVSDAWIIERIRTRRDDA